MRKSMIKWMQMKIKRLKRLYFCEIYLLLRRFSLSWTAEFWTSNCHACIMNELDTLFEFVEKGSVDDCPSECRNETFDWNIFGTWKIVLIVKKHSSLKVISNLKVFSCHRDIFERRLSKVFVQPIYHRTVNMADVETAQVKQFSFVKVTRQTQPKYYFCIQVTSDTNDTKIVTSESRSESPEMLIKHPLQVNCNE